MADITMPQLGETVTEGTITKWLKQVGDRVEEDEVIYEVSTDKVDSEVPSPVAGFLTEIVVPEGDTAEVGAVLAVVSSSPAAGGEGAAPAAAGEPETQVTPDPSAGGGDPEPTAGSDVPSDDPGTEATGAAADEVARSEVEEMGQPEPAAPSAPAAPSPEPAPAAGGGGSVTSPVVRRLLAENDLDPAAIPGSGPGGRVTRADVLAVIDSGAGAARTATAAPAAARVTPAPARSGESDTVVPFTNIRRRTAEHMVRSLQTSAHTLVVIEVDYDNVDRVRNAAKETFRQEEGIGLTYLPFVARAVVDAIREFPNVNASVGDDELIVHRDVNLAIAVDMDFQGLIAPVVQDAESKRLRALAREMTDLGRRAKARKLSADEIAGGTFTITNAGGFGTLITGPIINQPQVAILSTDGVKPRPVAIPLPGGDYGIAVHPVGNLAISFDHRAFDGAYASAFLAKLREILETRDWASELA